VIPHKNRHVAMRNTLYSITNT